MTPFPTLEKEQALFRQGFYFVAGVDEAGRGAWAGPVVAAAVMLPLACPALAVELQGVNDSKRLSPRRREAMAEVIQQVAISVGVGVSSHTCIDRQRIVPATHRAMGRAISALTPHPQFLLIDALPLPEWSLPQQAFPKADAGSLSVAAASIMAKVTRDRLMVMLDQTFPGYLFARHKGYGTAAHRAALAALGPCPIHRRSFAPIRQFAR